MQNKDGETTEYYDINWLEVVNTPNVPTKELVEKSIDYKLTNLRLEGIDWTGENKLIDGTLLFKIKEKYENESLNGITYQDRPILHGYCEVTNIYDYLVEEL
jgi:hypothetical protein